MEPPRGSGEGPEQGEKPRPQSEFRHSLPPPQPRDQDTLPFPLPASKFKRNLPPLPSLEEELARLERPALPPLPSLEEELRTLEQAKQSKLPPLPSLEEELKLLEEQRKPKLPPLPSLEEELRVLEEQSKPKLPPLPSLEEELRLLEEQKKPTLPPLPSLEEELRMLEEQKKSKLPPLPSLEEELKLLEEPKPKLPPLPSLEEELRMLEEQRQPKLPPIPDELDLAPPARGLPPLPSLEEEIARLELPGPERPQGKPPQEKPQVPPSSQVDAKLPPLPSLEEELARLSERQQAEIDLQTELERLAAEAASSAELLGPAMQDSAALLGGAEEEVEAADGYDFVTPSSPPPMAQSGPPPPTGLPQIRQQESRRYEPEPEDEVAPTRPAARLPVPRPFEPPPAQSPPAQPSPPRALPTPTAPEPELPAPDIETVPVSDPAAPMIARHQEPPRPVYTPTPRPAVREVSLFGATVQSSPTRAAPPVRHHPDPEPPDQADATPLDELKDQVRALLPGQGPPRVSKDEVAVFTRQISAMLAAGIPIHSVLEFYSEGDNTPLTRVIGDVAHKVHSGMQLSAAMRTYPQVFDSVYVGLVHTGEASGQLVSIFHKLAELQERQVTLRKKVVAALTYPAILTVFSVLGVAGFVYFVLPLITPLFDSMQLELPMPTRVLLMSRKGIPIVVLLMLWLGLSAWAGKPWIRRLMQKNPKLHVAVEGFPLTMPGVGPVMEKLIASRVLYSLATMLEVGIPVAQALARARSAAGNAAVAARLEAARVDLIDGLTVYDCLRANNVFPESALHLISVGEEASNLAGIFTYVANFYEEEVDYALSSLTALIEPIIMIGMGIVVGFITVSAALPTIQLLNNFS